MKTSGCACSLGHIGPTGSATSYGSHYKNSVVSIDGVQDFFYGPVSTRYGNQVINKVGYPIGSFFGYVAEGLYKDAAEVADHAKQGRAAAGRIQIKHTDRDRHIDLNDRVVTSDSHPDLTCG